MARIRSIKPGFFASEDVSVLPLRARLTWIGLWTHCDDQGRAKDNVKLIKAALWPLDEVSLREVEDDLTTLAAHGRIVRYRVDGAGYLAIVNWHDHQKVSKPTPSRLPGPPRNLIAERLSPPDEPVDEGVDNNEPPVDNFPPEPDTEDETGSGSLPGSLPESSRKPPVGKGKEGKGRDQSARARQQQAIRFLNDRYRLTDHEARQVIAEVQARAREPIDHPVAYFTAMAEGDLADIVGAVMDHTNGIDRARPADIPPPGDDPPAAAPWCGGCDEHTRLIDPDRPRRCPNCHPLRGQP